MPAPLLSSNLETDQAMGDNPHQLQRAAQPQCRIQQRSIFSLLPSELILDVFSFVDIVSMFRFLDTCRYHRYMLLNLPEAWKRVRFSPLSEFAPIYASGNVHQQAITSNSTTGPSVYQNHNRPGYRQPPRRTSGSGSDESDTSPAPGTAKPTRALKHTENERDRDRGGSDSLLSEIYAVLRRFRKENRLIDFVREVYMDGTDSLRFPSPIVMLIKFPHLRILSSRYRRNQTSLPIEIDMLKDMLRNGEILPHSLPLQRWDIFHPYMREEDVIGFKQVLDAFSIVGAAASRSVEVDKNMDRDGVTPQSPSLTRDKLASPTAPHELAHAGVALDIKLCPGPRHANGQVFAHQQPVHEAVQNGGAMHWATPGSIPPPTNATPQQPASVLEVHSTTSSTVPAPTLTCTNIVWEREKCRVCGAPQDRCWRCVATCSRCKAFRAPPFINHQTALERERQKFGRRSVESPAIPTTQDGFVLHPTPIEARRAPTPPGSISLSQLANPFQGIPTAYLLPSPSAPALRVPSNPPPPATLALPPEFSFFD